MGNARLLAGVSDPLLTVITLITISSERVTLLATSTCWPLGFSLTPSFVGPSLLTISHKVIDCAWTSVPGHHLSALRSGQEGGRGGRAEIQTLAPDPAWSEVCVMRVRDDPPEPRFLSRRLSRLESVWCLRSEGPRDRWRGARNIPSPRGSAAFVWRCQLPSLCSRARLGTVLVDAGPGPTAASGRCSK